MAFRQLLLLFIGLSAGGVVGPRIFAFLAMVGVLPRLGGVAGRKKQILPFETMMILGGIGGVTADRYQNGLTEAFRCVASRLLLFAGAAGWEEGGAAVLRCFGQIFLGIFGLAAGIFVGSLVMSLAETLKALPVLGRRLGLAAKGLPFVILSIAAGKFAGSLFYFFG